MSNSIRVGVYVDVVNLTRNGGYGMQYDVLREFATRDWGEPVRLNAYVAYDEERALEDSDYENRARDFQLRLRDFGYKVIEKKSIGLRTNGAIVTGKPTQIWIWLWMHFLSRSDWTVSFLPQETVTFNRSFGLSRTKAVVLKSLPFGTYP